MFCTWCTRHENLIALKYQWNSTPSRAKHSICPFPQPSNSCAQEGGVKSTNVASFSHSRLKLENTHSHVHSNKVATRKGEKGNGDGCLTHTETEVVFRPLPTISTSWRKLVPGQRQDVRSSAIQNALWEGRLGWNGKIWDILLLKFFFKFKIQFSQKAVFG